MQSMKLRGSWRRQLENDFFIFFHASNRGNEMKLAVAHLEKTKKR